MNTIQLAIVIPCFNEEASLPNTIKIITNLIKNYIERKIIAENSFILLVDDGSSDKTWKIITNAKKENKYLKGIKFTKNFGNQSAILAGYITSFKIGCDAVITIDADLQQDETKIEEFIKSYNEGFDVVCGVRNAYENKLTVKSITSALFYKIIRFLGVNLQPNHSEYRLVSKKVLKILSNYPETNIFIRGMIQDLGLKTKYIGYDIKKREYGVSKFSLISLLKLAVSGIVSYSTRPLRLVFFAGLIISVISCILALLLLFGYIFKIQLLSHEVEPFEIWETFIAGIQILCVGVIGEYIGQILLEVKSRPNYIIDEEDF